MTDLEITLDDQSGLYRVIERDEKNIFKEYFELQNGLYRYFNIILPF